MKYLLVLLSLLASSLQAAEVKSGVYHWDMLPASKSKVGITRPILSGNTLDLKSLDIYAHTLPVDAELDSVGSNKTEKLLIVKSGLIKLTIDGKSETLVPGSVAVLHPDTEYSVANADTVPSTVYAFRFISKSGFKKDASDLGPGSFAVNWDDLEYKPSEIGGRRDNFDCPTAMMNRFEFHTSTLNAGLTNHRAHTHRAEEMVLVLRGKVEMLIGEENLTATAGDVFFIEAEILHSLRNVGDETTEYFAFQWM